MGLGVHSNSFDILEDEDPTEEEESIAMILHDGTADAQIIHEAKMAKGVRNGAASSGDHCHAIEVPVEKARVSTSWTA